MSIFLRVYICEEGLDCLDGTIYKTKRNRQGKACELAGEHIKEKDEQVRYIRDKVENDILKRVPNAMVNGDREHSLPNTTSIRFENVEGCVTIRLLP